MFENKKVDFLVEMGQQIRKERIARGLSEEKLGEVVGYARETIQNIETGNGTPPIQKIMKLYEFLNIDIEDSFGARFRRALVLKKEIDKEKMIYRREHGTTRKVMPKTKKTPPAQLPLAIETSRAANNGSSLYLCRIEKERNGMLQLMEVITAIPPQLEKVFLTLMGTL